MATVARLLLLQLLVLFLTPSFEPFALHKSECRWPELAGRASPLASPGPTCGDISLAGRKNLKNFLRFLAILLVIFQFIQLASTLSAARDGAAATKRERERKNGK